MAGSQMPGLSFLDVVDACLGSSVSGADIMRLDERMVDEVADQLEKFYED